jgi:hypothetical protein
LSGVARNLRTKAAYSQILPPSETRNQLKAGTDVKVLICQSLDAVGRTEDSVLTAFTDGCSGLRRILADAGVSEVAILDWFHISMLPAAPQANSRRSGDR